MIMVKTITGTYIARSSTAMMIRAEIAQGPTIGGLKRVGAGDWESRP